MAGAQGFVKVLHAERVVPGSERVEVRRPDTPITGKRDATGIYHWFTLQKVAQKWQQGLEALVELRERDVCPAEALTQNPPELGADQWQKMPRVYVQIAAAEQSLALPHQIQRPLEADAKEV